MADDDDRSRDGSSAAGPGWSAADQPDTSWAQALAPDDIRELAGDIHAYHRECRSQRRRELFRRLRLGLAGTPLILVVAALAVVAVAATLLTVVGPRSAAKSPSAIPLTTSATPYGQTGHLLPPLTLTGINGPDRGAQTLRPGVVILLPPQCRCDGLLTRLDHSVAAAQLPLYAVAPSMPNADADALSGQLRAEVFDDPAARLRAAVGAQGVTAVLVHADGAIFDVDKDVTSANGLATELLAMLQPGTSG